MTATTLPEYRPTTFTIPDRGWLEPGDTDYAWVLDDLREHDAIASVLARIVVRDAAPDDAVLPRITHARRGRIELSWCNVRVVFNPVRRRRSYRINVRRSQVAPFDVDGKIVVWCDCR